MISINFTWLNGKYIIVLPWELELPFFSLWYYYQKSLRTDSKEAHWQFYKSFGKNHKAEFHPFSCNLYFFSVFLYFVLVTPLVTFHPFRKLVFPGPTPPPSSWEWVPGDILDHHLFSILWSPDSSCHKTPKTDLEAEQSSQFHQQPFQSCPSTILLRGESQGLS